MDLPQSREPARSESRGALVIFLFALLFSVWAVRVGWESKRLLGFEYRQTQTALSAYWIKAENNFSLAYPTPVLGKPWSAPMEFPLYQWTVVGVSNVTHWSLTKSGRAVSIACFYLCLPAIFLLLQRWQVPPGRRWLVLAVVVTCPFYLFYARGFLIETMALMFSVWFWVAFERAVSARHRGWLALAILAGTGAGLVKVTTFLLYLLPAAWWAGRRLWAERRAGWRRDLLWMALAVTVPFAVTLAWLHFSDATKMLNPAARFLTATNLRDYNLGTSATRWSAAYWQQKLRIVREELTWEPVLAICALVGVAAGRRRGREILSCLGLFGIVLVVFPVLYALHDYYYVANALLLLLAMGLALVALAETRVPRAVVFGVLLLVTGGQAWRFRQHQYLEQSQVLSPGSGLTDALQVVTEPNDVIIVLGEDWNSMVPFYSQRRALMIREDMTRDAETMAAALAQLAGEKVGAVVIDGDPLGRDELLAFAASRGITRDPVLVWQNASVHLPESGKVLLLNRVLDASPREVRLAPGVDQPTEGEHLKNEWREVASLRPWQRRNFAGMQPEPVRFISSFGPNSDGSSGRLLYNAHPDTRLVFALPAGAHTLRSTLQMVPDAWQVEEQHTDGVDVVLWALGADGARRELGRRYFNPRGDAADRAPARPFVVEFTLLAPGEVELEFGPGPVPDYTRDWVTLGPLTIE